MDIFGPSVRPYFNDCLCIYLNRNVPVYVLEFFDPKVINTREYALNKMIDVQTAIEELKNLAVYCDLLKVISEQHELQNLELVIQEKKAAVATVTTLRKSGIYEREILEVAETIRKSNSRSEPDSSQQADNN